MPKFSIVTTNYNDGHVLKRNFESVVKQNFHDYEHIVVDDCSTDNSVQIIEEYASANTHVQFYKHDINRGPAAGIGTGVAKATGDYISFLSADDEIDQNLLYNISKIIDIDPNAKMICGHIEIISDQGKENYLRKFFDCTLPTFISSHNLKILMSKGLFIVNGGGSFVKKDSIIRTPFNNSKLKWHCDALAFYMIGLEHGLWYIPECLHRYHLNSSNFSYGAKIWEQQELVIQNSLDLLNSKEYVIHKKDFIESLFFSSYPCMLRFIIKHYDEYSEYFNFKLILSCIRLSILRSIKIFTPKIFIFFYTRYLSKI